MKQQEHEIEISVGSIDLKGDLVFSPEAKGLVLFAHGSGSSRKSPRNRYVAEVLQDSNIATLLFDLLTPQEDMIYKTRFDIDLLTQRLMHVSEWVMIQNNLKSLPLGYFGASTGAAAALKAAAQLGSKIKSVVSRGGRPDLAIDVLDQVSAPTLFIVGGEDHKVIELNYFAYSHLKCRKKIEILAGASHLFEEPGTLEQAAELAKQWFLRCLDIDKQKS